MSTTKRDPYEKLSGRHILIVEAHPMMTGSVTQLFTEYDYASHAASGKQALEAIDRQRPDIILLDLMLPDISCLDVVRAVRQNEKTKSVLIVGMSAKPPERSECLAAGCDEFVLKPFGTRKLLDRLSGLLSP